MCRVYVVANQSLSHHWSRVEEDPGNEVAGGGSLRELRPCKLEENFALLAYGNCRDLPHPWNVLFMSKVTILSKKHGTFHWQISVPCTTQQWENVTTLYPISLKWSLVEGGGGGGLKTKKIKLLALRVDAVAYERLKNSDLTWKLLVFWKTGRLQELLTTEVSTVAWNWGWLMRRVYYSEKSRISCHCRDKETADRHKLSRRKIMAKPC